MREEKRLVVKDWFHEKKMNELGKNVQSTTVFAILKETEKAYNVFVGDTASSMTYWVPKSCTEWLEEENEDRRTISDEDYNTVHQLWRAEMKFYK